MTPPFRDSLALGICGLLVGASGTLVAATGGDGPQSSRPNIVFILTDDQQLDAVSAYGSQFSTPNLDRLAKEGMLFTRAYTTAPLCVPTRFTCLTGAWPSRNRWNAPDDEQRRVMNNAFFQPGEITVATALRAAGYETAFVGKDHSTASPDLDLVKLADDADPAVPEIAARLEENNRRLAERVKSYGFDYVGGLVHGNLDREYPATIGMHNMEFITHGALEFLSQRDTSKPFFLWFAATLTHSPEFDLKEDARVTPLGLREDHLSSMPSREELAKQLGGRSGGMPAKIASLDAGVGALLKRLDELGLAGNTLVMFMSDQDNRGKSTPYENGARVPLLARWPAVIAPGSKCDAIVENTDFVPTWLEVAGAKPLPEMTLDGRSLLPLFRGGTEALREAAFIEMGYAKAVSTPRWKYIAIRYPQSLLEQGFQPPQEGSVAEHLKKATFRMLTHEKSPFGQDRPIGIVDPDQLYDLENDPDETRNLAGDPAYADQLAAMRAILTEKVSATGRPFGEFSGAAKKSVPISRP